MRLCPWSSGTLRKVRSRFMDEETEAQSGPWPNVSHQPVVEIQLERRSFQPLNPPSSTDLPLSLHAALERGSGPK